MTFPLVSLSKLNDCHDKKYFEPNTIFSRIDMFSSQTKKVLLESSLIMYEMHVQSHVKTHHHSLNNQIDFKSNTKERVNAVFDWCDMQCSECIGISL